MLKNSPANARDLRDWLDPRVQEAVAVQALEGYSTFKVRRGGYEEIPLLQGKEKWLRFAGAAMKRYPTSKVRETQVRRLGVARGIRGQTH